MCIYIYIFFIFRFVSVNDLMVPTDDGLESQVSSAIYLYAPFMHPCILGYNQDFRLKIFFLKAVSSVPVIFWFQ